MSLFISAGQFDVIPDSSVSRSADSNSGSETGPHGLVMESTVSWPAIDVKMGSLADGFERIQIVNDSTGTVKTSKNISSFTGGDIFRINFSSDLAANTKYQFNVDANGNTYTLSNTSESLPISSSDGDLTITAGYQNGTKRSGFVYNIKAIGKLQ